MNDDQKNFMNIKANILNYELMVRARFLMKMKNDVSLTHMP